MKKYFKSFLLCVLVIIFSTAAYGADGLYTRGSVGFVHVNDINGNAPFGAGWTNKLDSGFALGIAAGYGFKNNYRFEAEVSYQKNDYDKAEDVDPTTPLQGFIDASGNLTNLSFLVNTYYDFPTKSAFTPFVGAGLGLAKIEINDLFAEGWSKKVNVDDTVFAYQLSAGVGYAINETLTIDALYRYLATDDPRFEDDTDYEFSSHNFLIGIRVNF